MVTLCQIFQVSRYCSFCHYAFLCLFCKQLYSIHVFGSRNVLQVRSLLATRSIGKFQLSWNNFAPPHPFPFPMSSNSRIVMSSSVQDPATPDTPQGPSYLWSTVQGDVNISNVQVDNDEDVQEEDPRVK